MVLACNRWGGEGNGNARKTPPSLELYINQGTKKLPNFLGVEPTQPWKDTDAFTNGYLKPEHLRRGLAGGYS